MEPQSFLEHLTTGLSKSLPRLATAGVILLLSVGLAFLARKVVRWLLRRSDPEAGLFITRVTFIGVLLGGILLALGTSGIHVAALATLMGSLGLAVSLSLSTYPLCIPGLATPGRAPIRLPQNWRHLWVNLPPPLHGQHHPRHRASHNQRLVFDGSHITVPDNAMAYKQQKQRKRPPCIRCQTTATSAY